MDIEHTIIQQIQDATGIIVNDTAMKHGHGIQMLVTDPINGSKINKGSIHLYYGGECNKPDILVSQLVNQLGEGFIEDHPELQKYAIPLVISDESLGMSYMLTEYSSMLVYNPSYKEIRDLSVIRVLNHTTEQSNIQIYRVYHADESLNEHFESISDMKLNKEYVEHIIRPFGRVSQSWLSEPLWMQSINTIMDFYQNPNNEDTHILLKDAEPLYKGVNLWVLANRCLSILVDGIWVNIPPDSVLPPKYQEEYQIFLNYAAI